MTTTDRTSASPAEFDALLARVDSKPAVDAAEEARETELARLLVARFPDYARWDWLDVARTAIAALGGAAGETETALQRVEALIDPETGMAQGNGYNGDRLFTELDIRRAIDGRWQS